MNCKKSLTFFLLFLLIPLLVKGTNESDVTISLGQLLSSFRTYQATFRQTTFDSRKRIIQRSFGRVMIKQPGRFRWQTNFPINQILIVSGKTLWLYNKDLSQITKQPLAEIKSINPAALLSGSIKNLNQNFRILNSLKGNTVVFQLIPRVAKNLNFKWVKLKFFEHQLIEMIVLNSLGELSVFQFKKIKINQPLADSLFEFKSTPGVDVVN